MKPFEVIQSNLLSVVLSAAVGGQEDGFVNDSTKNPFAPQACKTLASATCPYSLYGSVSGGAYARARSGGNRNHRFLSYNSQKITRESNKPQAPRPRLKPGSRWPAAQRLSDAMRFPLQESANPCIPRPKDSWRNATQTGVLTLGLGWARNAHSAVIATAIVASCYFASN